MNSGLDVQSLEGDLAPQAPWAWSPRASASFGVILAESATPFCEFSDKAVLSKVTSTPPNSSLSFCQLLRAEAEGKMLMPAP